MGLKNREQLKSILESLRSRLRELLGDRLVSVYLYGSQARGDALPDSDVDVLVVIRGEFAYFDLVEKMSYITAELSLRDDTVISCVFVSENDYLHRRTPLLINIRREGIPV
jgi:predicted nucleotidyltransferase